MLNPTPDTNDTSRVTMGSFSRAFLLVTAAFLLYVLIVLLLGFLPPTPQIPSDYDLTEWTMVEEQQLQQLDSYEMLDEEAGVVRIPIERAKELTVERGLPVLDADSN